MFPPVFILATHRNTSEGVFDMRTPPLKSMASGPLKIEKGTHPVLILATHRHTTESAVLGVSAHV